MLPPSAVRVAGTVAAVKDCDFWTMSVIDATIASASSSALLLVEEETVAVPQPCARAGRSPRATS